MSGLSVKHSILNVYMHALSTSASLYLDRNSLAALVILAHFLHLEMISNGGGGSKLLQRSLKVNVQLPIITCDLLSGDVLPPVDSGQI